jgi:hypothetical protein
MRNNYYSRLARNNKRKPHTHKSTTPKMDIMNPRLDQVGKQPQNKAKRPQTPLPELNITQLIADITTSITLDIREKSPQRPPRSNPTATTTKLSREELRRFLEAKEDL